jgi:hypothetical protein
MEFISSRLFIFASQTLRSGHMPFYNGIDCARAWRKTLLTREDDVHRNIYLEAIVLMCVLIFSGHDSPPFVLGNGSSGPTQYSALSTAF